MIYSSPRFLAAGDAALLVEFGDEMSEAANSRVRAFDATLDAAAVPGIIETIPAYRSLLVEYDPLRVSYAALQSRLAELAKGIGESSPQQKPIKQVPTIYGGEFGPDLADVAAAHDLTPDQVIAIHSGTVYIVYMLGFSPGFAYMGQVPESIAMPRLATPRTRVPAGSVAIATRQTGVYSQSTPGGWRLLGRTNIVLFDPQRDPACFFQPGDRVQFVPVDAHPNETHPVASEPPAYPGQEIIEVISPGLLTTVQDLGRPGYQRFGVPVSGAMDSFALRVGNALVGNPPNAAGLEITIAGPTLNFLSDALIAITGADLQPILHQADLNAWRAPLGMAIYVRGGSQLEFGGRRSGCRAYLTVAGGISVPPIMNSASTYLIGGFGGYRGRALQAGDILSVENAHGHLPSLAGRSLAPEHRLGYVDHPTIRVVLGPQDDYLTPEAVQTFLSQGYKVSTTSDRMGLRLQGPPLIHQGAKEIISSGIPLGAIQVPPDAQPIVLMADRQSVGGYPLIATVIQSDIPLLAQCLPGQSSVRFQAISVEEAQSIDRTEANRWQPEEMEPDAIAF